MSETNYILTSNGELYHYGVAGMKWGVRKASYKSSANERLSRKALKYDKKSAVYTKRSEKAHNKYDLEDSNKAAIKAAKYTKKAAKVRKKAIDGDDYDQVKAERKATKLEYKASKKQIAANRISKTTGYGLKAMKYSVKSDRMARKAAKARAKMASNKAYISMMNKRVDSLDKATLRKVETSYTQQVKEAIDKRRTSN